MPYKVKKSFNKFEREIFDICMKKETDYQKINYLLKNGASANAIEITEYSNGNVSEELLLTECWMDGVCFDKNGSIISDKDFCLKLLNLFIDNGLDVDKYINHIFENIHFAYEEKNFIEMTKIILNNVKNKENLNLESSLLSIGTEESYNNCCIVNHEYANILATIYEMIEGFANGNDVNKYYSCNKVIGQKIKNINIFCNDLKVDFDNKLISGDFDIVIECENDILIILNKYILVNNNKISSKYEKIENENRFLNNMKESIIGEKIENIELKNKAISSIPKTIYNITKIIISLSNNKSIIIDIDEAVTNMRIRYKHSKK